MGSISRPAVALPEPLRASEIPSFTNYSVVVRLPDIARRTLTENDFTPEIAAQIEALITEIPTGKIRQVDVPLMQDASQWQAYIRVYEGMDWLEVPWFFAEEYFYLRMLEASGYFQPGPGQGRDPYAAQKQLGLASSREVIDSLADRVGYVEEHAANTRREALARLLLVDLWGNQNDLSMWPVQKSEDGDGLTGGKAGHARAVETREEEARDADELRTARRNILADDLSTTLDFFSSLPDSSARVDILLDNAGYELVCDLALADFLLASGQAAQVVLHGKSHPVFVSDVIEKDIHETLDFLRQSGHSPTQALSTRLRGYLEHNRLGLRYHPFWSSPLPAWEMPDDLFTEIQRADLIISKGDANYRRLLGDRHWPVDIPFSRVVDYFPSAVLALRTLKSEIAVGIPSSKIPTEDPQWMINGRWGQVQFALPRR